MTRSTACGLLLAAWLVGGCAASRSSGLQGSMIPPGHRPSAEADEGGLWLLADHAERVVLRSGLLVRDADLESYVGGVVCRVAGPHCKDIRVYLIRVPGFNLSMASNGMMRIQTGALLRLASEAELASVIGHEIGHYARQHSVERLRDGRVKAAVVEALSNLAAAARVTGAPFGAVGQAGAGAFGIGMGLAGAATEMSHFAFSRDNEREADEIGLDLMRSAGYAPRAAATVWERLAVEEKRSTKAGRSWFFATHPDSSERADTLRELAKRGRSEGSEDIGASEFLSRMVKHWRGWLDDELRRGEFEETDLLLEDLLKLEGALGVVHFARGDLYRKRAGDGDAQRALSAYQTSIGFPDAPPEAHRNLAATLERMGRKAEARAALERYLREHPEAEDRDMIRAKLQRIE